MEENKEKQNSLVEENTATDKSKGTNENSATNSENIHIHSPLPPIQRISYCTYDCTKSSSSTFAGKFIQFLFSLDNLVMFNTKLKSMKQTEPIFIFNGTSDGDEKQCKFCLVPNETREAFSLRKNDQNGTELLALSMIQLNSKKDPKSVVVVYTFDVMDKKVELISKKPVLDEDGNWTLDFNDRYTIPSKENAILLNKETGNEMVAVRKIEEDNLELDALDSVPPVYAFAICLSFWYLIFKQYISTILMVYEVFFMIIITYHVLN